MRVCNQLLDRSRLYDESYYSEPPFPISVFTVEKIINIIYVRRKRKREGERKSWIPSHRFFYVTKIFPKVFRMNWIPRIERSLSLTMALTVYCIKLTFYINNTVKKRFNVVSLALLLKPICLFAKTVEQNWIWCMIVWQNLWKSINTVKCIFPVDKAFQYTLWDFSKHNNTILIESYFKYKRQF